MFTSQFPVSSDIVKCSHINSILIPMVEYIDDISVVQYFLNVISILHHGLYLLNQERIYLIIYMDIVAIKHKYIT